MLRRSTHRLAIDPGYQAEALARAEALIARSGVPARNTPRPTPGYCAPVIPCAPKVSPSLAAENLAGLGRFVALALATPRTGADRADYLTRMAKRLDDMLALIDAPDGDLPRHMLGVDASLIATARDRLMEAALRSSPQGVAAQSEAA